MAKIILLQSFRRGVGRSTAIANIATVLAMDGQRVGVVDTNIRSPSLHLLFGVKEKTLTYTLNTYLWKKCDLKQAVYRIGLKDAEKFAESRGTPGGIFLIPATFEPRELPKILNDSACLEALNTALSDVSKTYDLDALLIDSDAGLSPETLSFMAIADMVIIMMHCDQQDYQGTEILIDVARKLEVSQLMILVNEVPTAFDLIAIRTQISDIYHCPVLAAMPYSADMTALGGVGIFVRHYPKSPLTELYQYLTKKLMV